MEWKKKENPQMPTKFIVRLNRILNAKVSGLDCEHLPDDIIKPMVSIETSLPFNVNTQIVHFFFLHIFRISLEKKIASVFSYLLNILFKTASTYRDSYLFVEILKLFFMIIFFKLYYCVL